MNQTPSTLGHRARASVAVVAGLLLLTGAAWRGISAASQTVASHGAQTTVTTPILHPIAGARDSYADIVKVVTPAVVTIRVEGKATAAPAEFQFPGDDFMQRFFGQGGQGVPDQQPRTFRQRALGSGVIVTTDGYILTNYHVINGADKIDIEISDGRTMSAKLIGSDKSSDLAVLKINATGLHAAPIGNSEDVQVGDVVLAVGNPLGVGQTVTMGIISAKNRSTDTGNYEDFLQTDAPINEGNSGGALVNMKGELVGINSQIVSNGGEGNIGIGFAIPSNMAKHVMDELRTTGKVTRGQLGVSIQPVTSDMAASLGLKQAGGVIVSDVTPDSAADRAGIKRGDVIEAFNGQAVHDINVLRNHVADTAPGSSVDLTVLRDNTEKHMSVKLGEASADNTASNSVGGSGEDKAALGLSVSPLTPDVASRLRMPRDAHGVVVEQVNPDGRAADAGIQQGDVIEEVNRQPVRTVDDLRAAVEKTTDRPLLLLVNRQGTDVFVTVPRAQG